MNETGNTPPPVPDDQPDEQPTTVLGEQPATSPVPPAAPDQPTQVLGTDPTRVEAAYSGSPYPGAPYPGAGPDPVAGPAYVGAAASAGPPAGSYPQGSYPPPGAYLPPAGYPQGSYQQPGAYPPPGTFPPPGSQAPAGYGPPAAYQPTGPIRRLTRSRNQRVIGGVCGGLARYWNTDPTLLRILTVVLTLATGGAFLVGYLIAWIAIPDEPMGPTGPYGPADQVGYAAGGNPGYADSRAEYIPPAPRERSYLGWLVLSAAILAAGVLALIGFLVPASVGIWGVILGISLAILGVGMLVGTKYGRARWLLWLAIPLAFITFVTVTASNFVASNPNWDRWTATADGDGQWGGLTIGDRTWQVTPADAAESPLDFQLSAGAAVLDLTELTAIGDSEPADSTQRVVIDAGVGVGELIIVMPADMQLDLTGTVDIGQIDLPGSKPTEGDDLNVDTTVKPLAEGQPAYIVTLDAAIGAGNLEVRREAA
jgi:phage shock protein PspC (stress-responsive transcriptional regulator)